MKRTLTALVLAGTLAMATAATPTPAHAWRGWGWGLGGLALGAFIGAALVRPAYAYYPAYRYGYPAYSYGYPAYSYGYPAYSYGYGYPAYSYGYGYRPMPTAMAATTSRATVPPTPTVVTGLPSIVAGSFDGLQSTAHAGAEGHSSERAAPKGAARLPSSLRSVTGR